MNEVDRRIERLRVRNPHAVTLAQRVSFAVLIDPALLREVRLTLVPDADAGAEADLWFSTLVETRAPNGIVLSPDVAEALRRGLAISEAARAWEITERLHRHLPPALQLEEQLNWLSLDPTRNATRIARALQSAVGALVGAGQEHLANWAGRAMPRMPQSIRDSDAGEMLSIASEMRLGRPLALNDRHRARGIPSWLFDMIPQQSRTELGVRVGASGVEIGPATLENSDIISVPATDPMVVEVMTGSGRAKKTDLALIRAGETSAPIAIQPGQIRLRTLAREEYVLRPVKRTTTTSTVAAGITARAIADTNAVVVTWKTSAPIEQCLGFAIERRSNVDEVTVLNSSTDDGGGSPTATPTTEKPAQRYRWIDRTALKGVDLEYRVTPMLGTADSLHRSAHSSNWTSPVRVGVLREGPVAAYFNKTTFLSADPLVDSQSLAPGQNWKKELSRRLGGDLSAGLTSMLSEARSAEEHVYIASAAIEEPDIVNLVCALGRRAHVLVNNTNEPRRVAETQLKEAGVDVSILPAARSRRLHLNFAVRCRSDETPQSVWTAGGAWDTRNMMTRLRGAVVLRDAECAKFYLRHWHVLKAGRVINLADSRFTRALSSAETAEIWFAPVPRGNELERMRDLVGNTTTGILFCVDEVDRAGLAPMLTKMQHAGVYVSGIVTPGPDVELYSRGTRTKYRLPPNKEESSLIPRDPVDALRGGSAPLRHRFIVIDPFGAHPVVITGSHTFSKTASQSNEDLVVIRGSRALAAQYAARYLQIHDALQRRIAITQTRSSRHFAESPAWQDSYFGDEHRKQEVAFWAGEPRTISTALTAPLSAGPPLRPKSAKRSRPPKPLAPRKKRKAATKRSSSARPRRKK